MQRNENNKNRIQFGYWTLLMTVIALSFLAFLFVGYPEFWLSLVELPWLVPLALFLLPPGLATGAIVLLVKNRRADSQDKRRLKRIAQTVLALVVLFYLISFLPVWSQHGRFGSWRTTLWQSRYFLIVD